MWWSNLKVRQTPVPVLDMAGFCNIGVNSGHSVCLAACLQRHLGSKRTSLGLKDCALILLS
jgi:hypothetical protein